MYGGPKVSQQFQFYSRQFQFVKGNFSLFPAISISLTAISILFTAISILLTTISICSRQFQLTHSNFNLLTTISTYGNFNLLTAIPTYSAISICSRQRSRHFSLRSPFALVSATAADSGHQKSKRKIKSRYLKSIFKVKSENQKSNVDLRKLMPVDIEYRQPKSLLVPENYKLYQTLIWWPVNIYCTASPNGAIPHINPEAFNCYF